MTSTPGCCRSQVAKVSALWSSSTSTGRCVSKSMRRVPYVCPRRKAKSSTPRTRGVAGITVFFLARLRSVSALTGIANCSVSREPARPLSTTAMQSSSVPNRVVCRAQTGRSGKRSANVCRRQSGFKQRKRRTRRTSWTSRPLLGKSAGERVS